VLVVTRVPFEQVAIPSGVGACWGVQFLCVLMLGEVESDVSASLRVTEFEGERVGGGKCRSTRNP